MVYAGLNGRTISAIQVNEIFVQLIHQVLQPNIKLTVDNLSTVAQMAKDCNLCLENQIELSGLKA